jgi:hypothetical protein
MNERNKGMNHETTIVPISDLKPHPRNYRAHPQDQIDHLAKSIKEHGFYRPVVCTEDMTIIAGHGIVSAAKSLGLAEIPAVILPIGSDDAKALKILTGDNELMRLAEVDDRALSEILREIKDVDELLGTGFDASMLANLVMVTRPQSEIRDINEAAEWVGLPSYEPKEQPCQVRISFMDSAVRRQFMVALGYPSDMKDESQCWSVWYPRKEREDPSSLRFAQE